MLKNNEKILIHFDTNDVNIYKLVNESITLLEHKQVFFNETLIDKPCKVWYSISVQGNKTEKQKNRVFTTQGGICYD